MTLDEVKNYYGTTYKFTKLTGCNSSSWAIWGRRGYIPVVAQLKLELMSGGTLIADGLDQLNTARKKLEEGVV